VGQHQRQSLLLKQYEVEVDLDGSALANGKEELINRSVPTSLLQPERKIVQYQIREVDTETVPLEYTPKELINTRLSQYRNSWRG
jgi:hypothetical protein